MPDLLIKNIDIVLPDKILEKRCVVVDKGTIASILPRHKADSLSCSEVFDGKGSLLSPGFIDLHTHGLLGYQFDKDADDVQSICNALPSFGVTGVMAGLLPLPYGEDVKYIRSLSEKSYTGAELLGFFFEGPFISLSGAIPPESLKDRIPARVVAMQKAAKPYRSVFAVSPELENAVEIIEEMRKEGSPVFITHTAASVSQTQTAVEAGVTHATHFYDVFPFPPVTDPGVRPCGAVEVVLASPGVSVDFILDGEHVDPVAVRAALAAKGASGVCLVTDSSTVAGFEPGVYGGIGGAEVEVAYKGAPARGTENSPYPGGLAGSGLTMDRAVRNAVDLLDLDIPSACRMASLNPASVLGLSDNLGKIEVGYTASMVLLDKDLYVKAAWVKGRREY